VPTELDASTVRRWAGSAAEAVDGQKERINALNIFPVNDGDTGTNLALTLASAARAVGDDESPKVGDALQSMARGALLGARGNSGVILAQILLGFAEAFTGAVVGTVPAFADGLLRARDAAYRAVSDPVEGTILSVIAAVAEAVNAAISRTADSPAPFGLDAAVRICADAAREALDRTPEQLSVLGEAGVVDAGGAGLVAIIDELAAMLAVQPPPKPDVNASIPLPGRRGTTAREAGSAEFEYEVQYLLETEVAGGAAVEALSRRLGELGDSLAIVGSGDGLFNVHVHVNDVGAAIEAGIEAGRPRRITVVRFADQIRADLDAPAATGVVAVAPGDGLADLFRAEGVRVVDGGPTGAPSTEEVLAEIRASRAERVIILPNAAAVTAVAELAADQARADGTTVVVIPTKSPVQGLAAVAVHDDGRRFGDDVIAMVETAAATRFAATTVAVRDAITYAGRCAAGDVLGLIDGEIVEIGREHGLVAISLVSRLIGVGAELVTVLVGSDPGAADAARQVEQFVKHNHPLVELTVFYGGQPHFALLLGVE
jgi:DAK2 domain fusion protein YloV